MTKTPLAALPLFSAASDVFRLALLLFLLSAPFMPAIACDRPSNVPNARILLVGEVHGTNEAPEFIYQLACSTVTRGESVVIALEISKSLQIAIDEFMESEGREVDRERLLSFSFWSRPNQDGRSSLAMLTLIDKLRALSRAGFSVKVLAIDDQVEGPRDAGMAFHISESVERDESPLIALLGNYHARKVKGVSWDKDYEPAGYRLLRYNPANVLISQVSGSAWVCAPDCGVRDVGDPRFKNNQFGYDEDTTDSGYDGVYLLPVTTASFPAKGD